MIPSILGLFINLFSDEEVEGKDVLEVGSMDVNGSVRPMVQARKPRSYLGVDASAGPKVDRIVECTDLVETLGPDSADVVITTEMLEHVIDWQGCIENLAKVVRPGGLLAITTRSIPFPYHGFPIDTWRYSVEGMNQILDAIGFERILVCSDPEMPGVFVKARKPREWSWPEGDVFRSVDGVTVMKKQLKFIGLPFAPDGSGYYRFYLPWKNLAERSGHLIAITPPGSRGTTPNDEQIEQCDVLAMQRPCGQEGIKLWTGWKDRVKLVYETDDDLLRVDSAGLPHLHDETIRDQIRTCLRMSDMVTVSVEYLAEQMRKYNDNVVVLPNHINAELLNVERPKRDKVTIGYAAGASHLHDAMTMANPLRDVLIANPDVDMHFMGWDFSPTIQHPARWTNWSIDVWSYYREIDFDISLGPLDDTPFNRCKSPIKAMEAGALRIPFVGRNIPPYSDYVIDGVTGFLVNNDDEWRDRLTQLINEPQMREEMGAKGHEVASQWTIQKGWRHWARAYESLCPNDAEVGA